MTMSSAVGKKIPRRRRTPASSLPDSFLKSTGFSAVVLVQSVLLNDQANVMFTGLGESMFQHQTVVTGLHISPLIRQLSQSLDVIGGTSCHSRKCCSNPQVNAPPVRDTQADHSSGSTVLF